MSGSLRVILLLSNCCLMLFVSCAHQSGIPVGNLFPFESGCYKYHYLGKKDTLEIAVKVNKEAKQRIIRIRNDFSYYGTNNMDTLVYFIKKGEEHILRDRSGKVLLKGFFPAEENASVNSRLVMSMFGGSIMGKDKDRKAVVSAFSDTMILGKMRKAFTLVTEDKLVLTKERFVEGNGFTSIFLVGKQNSRLDTIWNLKLNSVEICK